MWCSGGEGSGAVIPGAGKSGADREVNGDGSARRVLLDRARRCPRGQAFWPDRWSAMALAVDSVNTGSPCTTTGARKPMLHADLPAGTRSALAGPRSGRRAHEETSSGDGGPTRASTEAEHDPARPVLLAAGPARLERRAASDGGDSRRCTRRLLQARCTQQVGRRIRAPTDAALAAKQRSDLGLFVRPGLRGAGAGAGCGPASPRRRRWRSGTRSQLHLRAPEVATPPGRWLASRGPHGPVSCMIRKTRWNGSRETAPARVKGASSTTMTKMERATMPAKVAVASMWSLRLLTPKK